ncbi:MULTISPECIES: GntR family transcriptional regulator [Streptomyces]|uniref:GntR family transcriptional regulator n=2 Tax=Streptomyces rimosus subsp. rimosus TaxID=132474 RepID=L8EYK9_STRR1|nr:MULTISPECIES: GntR family transcriptional regulator [Streptomyces]KOG73709.1 GntR family transcriptional regulator [Kitasatospora aureofaciens]MYT45516.1 GntR family transcriptional regulator [Streptomyces sp. SID5471]KEF03722.1 GntR family transcriptional regulator [Streptomyces rimosus]KUJ37411.1 GntR family transcriptional regulator [Streptomyces rimosus subsp. rimosus]QDA03827.1 GntR family transcriptional regulator [Streptomyces rimosus]
MLFRVDHASPVPLGDQIAASVRGALADGSVQPGERLPAARTVAESLGVNVHTVLRGYQRLKDEGLIDLRRGRGAVVTGHASPARARLTEHVGRLVNEARTLGLNDEEVVALVRSGLATG